MKLKNILLISSLLILTNCASITSDNNQPISIVVKDEKDKTLEDVKCTVVNDKGAWEVKAPGFVNILRSAEDISVTCKKVVIPMDLQKQYREHEVVCGVILYLVVELVPSSITIEEQVMLTPIR